MTGDPRLHNALRNLSQAGRVYVVLSTKGGVGKTTVAVLLALHASRRLKAGLMDADLTNPSTHILLGVDPSAVKYREEKGIEPYRINGLRYVTMAAYTGEKPLPLRGREAGEALRELLAIVKWGPLDILLIDTPPGVGDEHLDLLYSLKNIVRPLVVATPSVLSVRSVARLIQLLREAGYGWIGLVENMGSGVLRSEPLLQGADYLGYIPFTPGLEDCLRSRKEACVDPALLDTVVSRLLEA